MIERQDKKQDKSINKHNQQNSLMGDEATSLKFVLPKVYPTHLLETCAL